MGKDILAVAGYWQSKRHESGLGVLARANVVATSNALASGEFSDAIFVLGRVHQSIPESQAPVMQRWLRHLQDGNSNNDGDFSLPRINSTSREFPRFWQYLTIWDEFTGMTHLLNDLHLPRAKDLFAKMSEERARILGDTPVQFDLQPTSKFLTTAQAEWLRNSAEFAAFAEREKTPAIVRELGLVLPDYVKRVMEDRYVAGLPIEAEMPLE